MIPMRRTKPSLATFAQSQDGNMTIFSLFTTLLTLTVGGAALDFMRYEATRAEVQATLDRALLAAADLDQERPAEEVVRDYLEKSGFQGTVSMIDINTTDNHRTVEAGFELALDTKFLALSGIDALTVKGSGAASEQTSDVEISLVLDISDSMDSNNRFTNMVTAATDFVDTVVSPNASGSGLTTVSIVPYNSVVNMGERLANYYTLTENHDYSTCVTFGDGDFDSTAISRTAPLNRIAHFDYTTSSENSYFLPNPWCVTGETNAPMIHSTNVAAMDAYIRGLETTRNTAIHLGVKWGAALLDPSLNALVADQVAENISPAGAQNRPAAFSDRETAKVMVVMTDGANSTEWDLKPEFKFGMSNIWVNDLGNDNPRDDRFSMRIEKADGSVEYFLERFESNASLRYGLEPDGGADAVQMTNAEVYARWGMPGYRKKFFDTPWKDRRISYADYFYARFGYDYITRAQQADTWLSEICTASKSKGIVIYSVAFEAEEAGEAALRDCASSDSHYFEANGSGISDVFTAIARQINNLRLTK